MQKLMFKIFTLVELLMVIAIIAILSSILLPSLNKINALSKSIVCTGNQKQLGLAEMSYLQDNDEYFFPWVDSNSQAWCTTINNTSFMKSYIPPVYPGNKGSLLDCPSISEIPSTASSFTNYAYTAVLGHDDGQILKRLSNVKMPSRKVVFTDCSTFYVLYYWMSELTRISWAHQSKANTVFLDGHVASNKYGSLTVDNYNKN